MKIVYMIINTKGGREVWNRIGVAFENSDGSLNVMLNAFPIDGKLHIRDAPPKNVKKYPPDNDSFNDDHHYDAVVDEEQW